MPNRSQIAGEVGDSGENIAVGKGLQQVHIDLGNKSPDEIAAILRLVPRLNQVIFGDGYGPSIVRDLEEIKRNQAALDAKMKALEANMEVIREETSDRKEAGNQMRFFLFVTMVGVILLVVLQLWKG